jgi:carbonic anhydrase/acetyltransferase-like protein (isoleucine patch superfamily)
MAIRPYKDKTPVIGNNTYVDPAATIIGDVEIGSDCSLWPATVTRGDVNHIRIGNNTNIQDGSVLHVTHYGKYGKGSPLIIGNNVTVGHSVVLHACTIGDNSLIGMHSTVLDEVIVEPYVMIGAGSLVPQGKTLESGHMYFGNPVKKIRPLTDEEKEFLKYSAEHYVLLKDEYL